jgi:hypothetical protein
VFAKRGSVGLKVYRAGGYAAVVFLLVLGGYYSNAATGLESALLAQSPTYGHDSSKLKDRPIGQYACENQTCNSSSPPSNVPSPPANSCPSGCPSMNATNASTLLGTIVCPSADNCSSPSGAPPQHNALGAARPGLARPATGGWSGGPTSTYWLESTYTGTNQTGGATPIQIVYTSLQVPSSAPASGDQYVLALSVFDSNSYFDQIGLASDYGCTGCGNSQNSWTIFWEQGDYGTSQNVTGCGWGGSHSRDAAPFGQIGLSVFGSYTFFMYLSDTNLEFRVYNGTGVMNGTPYWSHSITDSATTFEWTNLYHTCSGGTYGSGTYSASLFEEVDYVHAGPGGSAGQDVPQWNFNFSMSSWASWGSSSWVIRGVPDSQYEGPTELYLSIAPTIPHSYYIDQSHSARSQMIANEAMGIVYTFDTFTLAVGANYNATGKLPSDGWGNSYGYQPWSDYCLNNTCDLSFTCTAPSGLSILTAGATSPTVSAYVWDDVKATSSAVVGNLYFQGCTATITNSPSYDEYTTFIFYITIS